MPELNHKFTLGRMNKDADERLVKNGEYRDALNAQVSTSDGSDMGTLQNLLGNLDVSGNFINTSVDIDGNEINLPDFEYHCVGSITDEKTDRIYWLLAGVGKDVIAEYDYTTKVVTPVVVDIYNFNVVAEPGSGRVLNFDKNFLVTGINIIDEFMFWTDNNTEPKQLNLKRAKLGCINPMNNLPDFNYQTDLYVKSREHHTQIPPFINVGKIREEHITVIKKAPLRAPRLEMKNTLRLDRDADGTPGVIDTTLSVNDPVNTLQDSDFKWIGGDIVFQTDTLADYKRHDLLVLTLNTAGGALFDSLQQLSEIVIRITSFPQYHAGITWPASGVSNSPTGKTGLWFKAEIVSGNLMINANTEDFNVTLKQTQALFKFKFPRFASRYKYTDGQYSTFSPFSEVAFLPSEFDYLPKEGYNLGMVNSVRKLAVKDFVDKNQIPDDVVEIDILYKESNSPIVYTVDTVKRVDIFTGVYDNWNGVDANTTSTQNTTGFLNITSEVVHAMLPSNQLLRGWDNVPRKALAQEIVGNRIVYANYLQNYDMHNDNTFRATAMDPYGPSQSIMRKNSNITVDLRLQHVSTSLSTGSFMIPELSNPFDGDNYKPAKSIKSLRTYQLGVSYIDEFGRETPVFTSSKLPRNSIQVDKGVADTAGKLKAKILNTPPQWAKNFKFLIKESSNEYYNLAMDRWYPAQDGNIWLSFPSSERNKVDEETFLILKKEHNSDTFVSNNTKYKILAIDNEAPLFIKTRRVPRKTIQDGGDGVFDPITGIEGRIIGTNALGFNDTTTGFPAPDGSRIVFEKTAVAGLTAVIEKEGISDWEFRVRHAIGGTSKWYKIQSYEEDLVTTNMELVSKKKFGVDMTVTSPISWITSPIAAELQQFADIQVEFVQKQVKNRPEFDGRFFVKVINDSAIKKAIVGYPVTGQSSWTVINAITSQYIDPEPQYGNGWDDGQGGLGKFFGIGNEDHISISENDMGNGATHSVHQTINNGGQWYWDRAGKTSYNGSSSSGWFIDKIEAFRPWRITGNQGWNYGNPVGRDDDAYNTNLHKSTFHSFSMRAVLLGAVTLTGYNQQLKLVGTNTHSSSGANYLNQPNLKAPGTMLRSRDGFEYGGVIPSLGISQDPIPENNIIHLSYSGIGINEGRTPFTNLNQLKNHFGVASWANSFRDEQEFVDRITQPGTLWRWKEDPDGIIYRTTGYDPGMTSGGVAITNTEWNNNTLDKKDNFLGVSLYNYTQFSDYLVKHMTTFRGWSVFSGAYDVGVAERSHFVSAGWEDETVPLGLITYPAHFALLAIHAANDLAASTTSAGWGSSSNNGYKYPSFTEEWGKARNRRRRFMFAAVPYIDGNGEVIDSAVNASTLGNVTNNDLSATGKYSPTNDPDLPSHFDAATSTPLTSFVNYGPLSSPNSLSDTATPRPITMAPGIRPDGVYSGAHTAQGQTVLVPAIKTNDMTINPGTGVESIAPGSCTWEIVEPYLESDDDGNFTTTNPAIWETEPKEDLDLDLYYEVGQTYPTELNKTNMEQFLGPIRDNKNWNTKVTCWMPPYGTDPAYMIPLNSGLVYTAAQAAAAGDPSLLGTAFPGSDDIRVVSHAPPVHSNGDIGSDHHVWLEDINGIPLIGDIPALTLYPLQIVPEIKSRLMFHREDGSRTESSVKSQGEVLSWFFNPISGLWQPPTYHNAWELENDTHNYEVVLPWHNCYSFGNGVESNRIRDDYNQVFIDKGAKVSTVLQEPYLEDRRSSGLIYSGIYNSISNVNNLNQFIQAEKITKDLNPDGGSIQKLYARDTNLVTICEDKVFKILANKDALFNADGNPQLVATDKVLGEATTFAGDYGISTSPESFAVDSFRMYFADRVRGSVLRLSQDGLTPISSIGMTDWFNDNLVGARRLVGSFDDKKKEYNLNLNYYDYATYAVSILCDSRAAAPPMDDGTGGPTAPVGPPTFSPRAPGILVLNGDDASHFNAGDTVIGQGIPLGSVITEKIYKGGGTWWIKLNQTPLIADMWALLPIGVTTPYPYGIAQIGGGGQYTFPTRITASTETQPSNTISFSEKNRGWVSFKSFLKEGGLSLNNEYFTFKRGMLYQHHTNPIHNNFYEEQFDSSVEVLLNDLPGSVKSFGTLNYEGSQSHITQDLQNSGEYWDNKNKLGWYVDNMYTDLQQGDLHEFKDKEGKWFSQIKGVTTKWLDDGTGGNIDTNEFSYQGVDDNNGVTIISGGYTSWNCSLVPTCGGDYRPNSQMEPARDLAGNIYRHYDAQAAAAAGDPNLQNPSWVNYVWLNTMNPGPIGTNMGDFGVKMSGWGWNDATYGVYGMTEVNPSIVMGISPYTDPCYVNGVDNADGYIEYWDGMALTDPACNIFPNAPLVYYGNFSYAFLNLVTNGSNHPQGAWTGCAINVVTPNGQSILDAFLSSNLVWELEYDANGNSIFGANVFGLKDMLDTAGILWDTSHSCKQCLPGDYAMECNEVSGLGGTYSDEHQCLSDTQSECGNLCTYTLDITTHGVDAEEDGDGYCNGSYAHVTLASLDPTAATWSVYYRAVNVANVAAGTVFTDPATYSFFGDSNAFDLPSAGEWNAVVTDSNGCFATALLEIGCDEAEMCDGSANITIQVSDATEDGACPATLNNGLINVIVSSGSYGSTYWSAEYFSVDAAGVTTSIYVDDNNGGNYYYGDSSELQNLQSGNYIVVVTDSAGCVTTIDVLVDCAIVPVVECMIASGDLWDYTFGQAIPADNVECNNGVFSLNLAGVAAAYTNGGQPLPTSFTVQFWNSLDYQNGTGAAISMGTYNVSSLPITLTEPNLEVGESYGWLIKDNNGCDTFVGIGPVTCNYVVPVYGCTDSQSINYDPLANTDDGSCIRPPRINRHRLQHSANCSPNGTYGAYECLGSDLETGWSRVKEVRVNTSATSFTIQYYKYPGTGGGCPTNININTPIAQQFQLPGSATPVGPLQGPFLVSNLNVIQTYGPNVIIESQQGNGPQFHLDLGGMDNLSNNACSGKKYAIEITDNNGLSSAVCIDIGNKPRVTQLNDSGHIAMNAVFQVPMGSGWNWHQYPDSNNPFWHAFAPKATITVTDATGPNCDDGQIEVSNIIVGGCSGNYSVSLIFAPGENGSQLPCTSYTCWNHPDNVVNVNIPSSSSNSVVFGNLNSTAIMHPLYPGYGLGNYYIEILDNMGNRARYSSAVHWSPGVLLPNGNLIVSC